MKKQEKTALVAELSDGFRRSNLKLVSESRGITAAEATDMRRRLRAARGELKVAKNTLIRRAIKETGLSALEDKLGGPVGIILSFEDPVAVAKTVASFKEFGERFKVRGGVLDGKPLTAAEIAALAALPPKEVVLAQLLALINAPATRLARLLNEPGSALARVVDAIGKKNGAGAAAAENGAAGNA